MAKQERLQADGKIINIYYQSNQHDCIFFLILKILLNSTLVKILYTNTLSVLYPMKQRLYGVCKVLWCLTGAPSK